ncbi:MAG: DUF268 domain-containing protein [Anaerolineae bacterium]|jgi:SAM-dependent methyltransferase
MRARRWLRPLIPAESGQWRSAIKQYIQYWRDWQRYRRLPGSEALALRDAYPCLYDNNARTRVHPSYFHQDIWALGRLIERRPSLHVDVGSNHTWVGMVTTLTRVVFVDIRPLRARVRCLLPVSGSIIRLPFADDAVASLSCLHVVEHIGLGRYGDPLDPAGTRKAVAELKRVLAPGGHLYLSLPLGRPAVHFNAHRIHSPGQILDYTQGLELASFSSVKQGAYHPVADLSDVADGGYAFGLFDFLKPEPASIA